MSSLAFPISPNPTPTPSFSEKSSDSTAPEPSSTPAAHESAPTTPNSPADLRNLFGNPEYPICTNKAGHHSLNRLLGLSTENTMQSYADGLPAHCFSLSNEGAKLLKDIEQLKPQPYDDSKPNEKLTQWNKNATIGYGHLIKESEWEIYKNGITEAQAESLFAQDTQTVVDRVHNFVSAPLQQYQFDALVIFAYNMSEGNFKNSSALKMINDPSAKTPYATLEDAWKAFNKITDGDGKKIISQGLVNRRNAEWDIFSKAEYKRW